ncbi:MAG: hypothetical protein AAGB13_12850 [Cyanobacteria bacterium P01_F01_bin.33]
MPPSSSAKIVGNVGHDIRRLRTFDANTANHQVHLILLMREHMLGACPHSRFLGIRPSVALWYRFVFWLLSMNLAGRRPNVEF